MVENKMKPVFIIAIVAVAMIGMITPMTVFGAGAMTETLPPIMVDKTIYYPGEIIEISGNIRNVMSGVSVDIVLTNPDGSTEEFRTPCKTNGDYSMMLIINSEYKLGEYSIASYYDSKFVGKKIFSIMTKSQINDESSVIESLPELTKGYYVKNNLVYTMESSWMEPTIKKGDVVIAEKIPFEDIKIGDIIMYQQPAYPENTGVSRVITILDNNPKIIRASSGDAYSDKWIAGISSPITEKEYVGKVIEIMSSKEFMKLNNLEKIVKPVVVKTFDEDSTMTFKEHRFGFSITYPEEWNSQETKIRSEIGALGFLQLTDHTGGILTIYYDDSSHAKALIENDLEEFAKIIVEEAKQMCEIEFKEDFLSQSETCEINLISTKLVTIDGYDGLNLKYSISVENINSPSKNKHILVSLYLLSTSDRDTWTFEYVPKMSASGIDFIQDNSLQIDDVVQTITFEQFRQNDDGKNDQYFSNDDFSLKYPDSWHISSPTPIEGMDVMLTLISDYGDEFTISKEPVNVGTIITKDLWKQTANMYILGMSSTCEAMTWKFDEMICYDFEIIDKSLININGIDVIQINNLITHEDVDYYYYGDYQHFLWIDPNDGTFWMAIGSSDKDSPHYTEISEIITSMIFENRLDENNAISSNNLTDDSTIFVNEKYGFSLVPPSGWIEEGYVGTDKIESKIHPGMNFEPIIRYFNTDSNAEYVLPVMSILVMNSEIELDLGGAFQNAEQSVIEGILESMKKMGHEGYVINSETKQLPNGGYVSMEIYLQMNFGVEELIPIKMSADAWMFEDGIIVYYVYMAEPDEYTKHLNDFKKSANSVYFKPKIVSEKQDNGGGCLIATATYGSELAPQVQQLRELRDNQLLQTESGTAFMATFNDVYYSFSPIIADYERENPYFKEAVKLAITPMINSLSLMENAETESEVLSIGISVMVLNLGMYLGIPAIIIIGIRKQF
jgi:hypothetical protein